MNASSPVVTMPLSAIDIFHASCTGGTQAMFRRCNGKSAQRHIYEVTTKARAERIHKLVDAAEDSEALLMAPLVSVLKDGLWVTLTLKHKH